MKLKFEFIAGNKLPTITVVPEPVLRCPNPACIDGELILIPDSNQDFRFTCKQCKTQYHQCEECKSVDGTAKMWMSSRKILCDRCSNHTSHYAPPGVYVSQEEQTQRQLELYTQQIDSMMNNGVITQEQARAELQRVTALAVQEQIRASEEAEARRNTTRPYASPDPTRPRYRSASFITTESFAHWLHDSHIIGRWRIVEPRIKQCFSQQWPRGTEGYWTCRIEAEIITTQNFSGWINKVTMFTYPYSSYPASPL